MSCVVIVELVMSGNTQVDVDLKLCSFVVREDTNCQLNTKCWNPRVSLCRRDSVLDCRENLGKLVIMFNNEQCSGMCCILG